MKKLWFYNALHVKLPPFQLLRKYTRDFDWALRKPVNAKIIETCISVCRKHSPLTSKDKNRVRIFLLLVTDRKKDSGYQVKS